jgi:hypothetical protein
MRLYCGLLHTQQNFHLNWHVHNGRWVPLYSWRSVTLTGNIGELLPYVSHIPSYVSPCHLSWNIFTVQALTDTLKINIHFYRRHVWDWTRMSSGSIWTLIPYSTHSNANKKWRNSKNYVYLSKTGNSAVCNVLHKILNTSLAVYSSYLWLVHIGISAKAQTVLDKMNKLHISTVWCTISNYTKIYEMADGIHGKVYLWQYANYTL